MEIFKLVFLLVCLVIVAFLFLLVFFLNENCICCVTELSWKKSYSLAPAMALGGRA